MSQLLATLSDAAQTAAAAAAQAAHEKPTFLDEVASVIIIIACIAAFLSLGGLIVLMSIGAMSSRKQLSSSWAPHEEATFIPFENHNSSSQMRAWGIALATAAVVLIFAIGIKFGVEPAKQCEAGKKLDKNGKCADAQVVDREAAKPATPAPAASEPKKAEEPKKEEPKAEEPKKEEPKAEEPKKE
jgi:hypothetical protein